MSSNIVQMGAVTRRDEALRMVKEAGEMMNEAGRLFQIAIRLLENAQEALEGSPPLPAEFVAGIVAELQSHGVENVLPLRRAT